MYKLYTRPGSGGFVVEAALAMAGAPFDRMAVRSPRRFSSRSTRRASG